MDKPAYIEMCCIFTDGTAGRSFAVGERRLPATGPAGRPPAADRYGAVCKIPSAQLEDPHPPTWCSSITLKSDLHSTSSTASMIVS